MKSMDLIHLIADSGEELSLDPTSVIGVEKRGRISIVYIEGGTSFRVQENYESVMELVCEDFNPEA